MSFLMLPLYHLNDNEGQSSSVSDISDQNNISEDYSKKPYQLLPKNQFPEKCAVCQHAAIGYHYNVPSCNGCKTFFRRTIVNGRRFICMNKRNCLDESGSLDESKRMCKACRFARCVEVGMDPTAIRAAVKTTEGKYLLDEVTRRQRTLGEEVKSRDDFLSNIIKQISYLEKKAEELHFKAVPFGYEDLRTLSEILLFEPEFDSYKIPNLTPILNRNPKVVCMTYMHSALLAAVESSKTFEFYSKISHDTKIIFVKHVALIGSIMMSASFSMHLKQSDELLLPDGTVYGNAFGCMGNELLQEYRRQIQNTLRAFLRNNVDRVEYMLLKAILMRNPAVSGISSEAREIIEHERNQYAKALLEYNILQYGVSSGPARFGALIAINPIIEMQSKMQKDVYLMIKASSNRTNCSHPPKYLFDEVMDS
ncbi:hypothetical protein GCK72_018187 [Caenorhabditis remanei]|uniref:Uncharacterized protein n=1 Tax=Caenorhabditis remanei TaxID=31234 RepID=A0A6A5GAC8_CAERE|nr:hypothetical protein GCK72_018187 [Caenorhabditis remanei]KAF1751633.1 hypothetical protein GCK72_018187 [Caenorhabditis remanei]